MIKFDIEKAKSLYLELGNVWKVGEEMGCSGQKVHYQLTKSGDINKMRVLSEPEKDKIKALYTEGFVCGDGKLNRLCLSISRTKPFVCRYAEAEGLTNRKRKLDDQLAKEIGVRNKEWIKENGHPRGMLGKKHTDDVKEIIGDHSDEMWDSMTEKDRSEMIMKRLKTKHRKGILHRQRTGCSWKQGWREIGGMRKFYRSRWEANYARYLDMLQTSGEISSWEHEPDTFWFEAIMRGTRSYLPDFKVTEGDETYYIEVKGWMDPKSITKLKRMKKYHPEVEVRLVDAASYRKLAKSISHMIKGWEFDKDGRN